MQFSKLKTPLLVILLILIFDQVLKIYIKLNFYMDEEVVVIQDFFVLHFTENPGMAFGWKLPFFDDPEDNKLFLSIFRVVAVFGIGWYLVNLVKKSVKRGLLIAIALIFAGAMGNIIDSAFYGLIFSSSPDHTNIIAEAFPARGGYAGFLSGKVVDMFHFPIFKGHWPSWVPYFGVDHNHCDFDSCDGQFMFFRPIFNVADTAISTGVGMILVFNRRYFKKGNPVSSTEENDEINETEESTVPSEEATPEINEN